MYVRTCETLSFRTMQRTRLHLICQRHMWCLSKLHKHTCACENTRLFTVHTVTHSYNPCRLTINILLCSVCTSTKVCATFTGRQQEVLATTYLLLAHFEPHIHTHIHTYTCTQPHNALVGNFGHILFSCCRCGVSGNVFITLNISRFSFLVFWIGSPFVFT